MLLIALIVTILSYALQIFLPWWIFAPVSLATCAAIAGTPKKAFVSCFAAVFLLWAVLTYLGLYTSVGEYAKMAPDNLVENEILAMTTSKPLVVLISALTGGILAGVAGMAGYYIRDMANMEGGSRFSPL